MQTEITKLKDYYIKEKVQLTHSIFHSRFHYADKSTAFHTYIRIHMVYIAYKTDFFHQQFFSKLMGGQQTSKNISASLLSLFYELT